MGTEHLIDGHPFEEHSTERPEVCGYNLGKTLCLWNKDQHMMIESDRPVHATDTIPAVQAWDAYSAMVRDLIIRKVGYGNSWQHQGYMGNIGRVLSKADRLKETTWRDQRPDDSEVDSPDRANESILDTLLDLGPLAAFAIANIDEGNRWGR